MEPADCISDVCKTAYSAFVHCDFPSRRYYPVSTHSSEKMAQQFVGLKFTESEFNLKIREMYGEKEDKCEDNC